MNDSFSQPDPAQSPDEEPEFPSIPDDPAGDTDMVLVEAEASCLDCSHFEVCSVFAGIQPMMEDWHTDGEDAEAPIDVEKLAWHCRKYDPVE